MLRRDFIKCVGIASIGGLPWAAKSESKEKGRKISLHFFSKPLQWLSYDALAETLAKAGFEGIDLTVRPKGHVEPQNAGRDIPLAVEAARKQGLKVEMISTAITSPRSSFAEQILKTSAQCGVKVYRTGCLEYETGLDVEACIEKHHRTMEALASFNQKCDIAGCYQNHYTYGKMFGGVVWDIYYMLKGLDPQWMGCQYDIRHAVAESGGAWDIGMRLIAPYIRSVCLKDFTWQTNKNNYWPKSVPAGEGVVPWERYFNILKTVKGAIPASVHCEWPLFTKEEEALPENRRREIAVSKLKRDRDFYASAFSRYGLA